MAGAARAPQRGASATLRRSCRRRAAAPRSQSHRRDYRDAPLAQVVAPFDKEQANRIRRPATSDRPRRPWRRRCALKGTSSPRLRPEGYTEAGLAAGRSRRSRPVGAHGLTSASREVSGRLQLPQRSTSATWAGGGQRCGSARCTLMLYSAALPVSRLARVPPSTPGSLPIAYVDVGRAPDLRQVFDLARADALKISGRPDDHPAWRHHSRTPDVG